MIEVHADTLLFAADHQSTRTLIPAASLTGVEVSQGMHSHVLAGAGLGFLGGAVAGGVIGYGLAHEQNSLDGDWGPVGAAVGAGIVGAVGAGVGALVGSRRTERWGALRLPINVGLLPSTDALGLSLAVTLMPRTSWKP